MDVEAVCKGQCLALGHVGGNLRVVDVGAELIGHEHHDDITGLGSLFDLHDLEVLMGGGKLAGLLPVGGTLAQANDHIDAALGQVFGVGVALRAEADDGNGLAVEHAEVAIGIVILVDSHGGVSFLLF